jgi:hypothetical protein
MIHFFRIISDSDRIGFESETIVEITIYFLAERPQGNAKSQAGRAVSMNHQLDSRSSKQMARALHKREDRYH